MRACCRRSRGDDAPDAVPYYFTALSALVFMPLSQPISRRALKHTRVMMVEAFARDDGLWDLDARITDTKTGDAKLASGVRPAGMPIHDLLLRITIDVHLTIVHAEAFSEAVPFTDYCETVGPSYASLIGLSLMQGFRHGLQERMAGIKGCTHLTELGQILPTAAVQALAGEPQFASALSAQQKPFQIDHCHAMRSDGAAVARYYPKWAVKPATG